MVENISISYPKAKKKHNCDLCLCDIEPGEVYESQRNKVEGRVYVFKNHIRCHKLARYFKMYEDCDEGLTDDLFLEEIMEVYIAMMEDNNFEDFTLPETDQMIREVINYYNIDTGINNPQGEKGE